MNKTKENAFKDWFDMIVQSWTWNKLTESEREIFTEQMDSWCNIRGLLSGTYKQRWEILNEMYYMYLLGTGYKLSGWKESTEGNSKFKEENI